MKNVLSFLLFASVLATSLSCRKEKAQDVLPNVTVDIYIYISNPSYIKLTVVGGWMYVAGGIRGVLIYRKSTNEFIALERNCTYKPDDPCSTVVVDHSNIIATDTCCHSEFLLTDGSVIKAPASYP